MSAQQRAQQTGQDIQNRAQEAGQQAKQVSYNSIYTGQHHHQSSAPFKLDEQFKRAGCQNRTTDCSQMPWKHY